MRNLLKIWWAWKNSNLRPLPCQGSQALTLQSGSPETQHLAYHDPAHSWTTFAKVDHAWTTRMEAFHA